MSNYTPQEFYEKCDYEGGVLDGIFGYGLRATDLAVQEGPFYEAVKELAGMARRVRELEEVIQNFDVDQDEW